MSWFLFRQIDLTYLNLFSSWRVNCLNLKKGRRSPIKSYIYLTREQLYQEAWETSLRGIAQKHNLNYDSLFRKFRDEKIPHPDNSYLARRSQGKKAAQNREPLPGNPEKKVKLLTNNDIDPADYAISDRSKQLDEIRTSPVLDFLPAPDQQKVIEEISIITADETVSISPASAGYIELNRRRFSPENTKRAALILSALVQALQRLGAKTASISESGYYLSYRGATLQFQMKERTTQYKLSLKALDKNPSLPRFEQRFNGRLELNIQGEIFADDDDYTLEYQLGRILQAAVEKSEEILSQTRDNLSRQQEGEKAFQKINALYRDADAHDRAKRIRAYVQDVLLQNFDDPDIRKWAQWALDQADQLDPPAKFRSEN